jgi:hypothetical protein
MLAILGPFGVPLLIELECNLQSMILFQGLFIVLFILPAALTLRRFLKSELSWPGDQVEAWSRASILGTIAALIATVLYALSGVPHPSRKGSRRALPGQRNSWPVPSGSPSW